jgi:hypothetical protein
MRENILTPSERGLDQFAHDLNPAIVGMIRTWQGDEELDVLYHRLQARKKRRGFLDSFAEALVALNARRHGCSIEVEVPTPSGKMCDLLLQRDDVKLYVHVKRLGGTKPRSQRLKISSRLRILEQIEKPWVVKIRWKEDLDDEAMQYYVTETASFIEKARLGDEHVVRDSNGDELGGVKIVSPHDEKRVSLVIGIPSGFVDESPRVGRLLHRAHKQFMPKETNIIMVCTPHLEGLGDVETALFGSHVERWDEHPAKGTRVAHGRSADGFWQSNLMTESQLAGWLWFAPMHHDYQGKLWIRDNCDVEQSAVTLAKEIFSK